MLPTFECLKPQTLAEALRWLTSESNAIPIAGGTNLIVDTRAGRLTPDTVIDLSGLPELRGVDVSEDEIRIGACTTIVELLSAAQIERHAPVLHAACTTFANTLIRNRATIGGNLVNNAPCADTAPALLVLDAVVELAREDGVRHLLLGDFLVEPFATMCEPDEIVTAVQFPMPSKTSIGRFRKMGLRKVSCMAKVDVAAQLTFEGDVCAEARIALAAAAPVALRARDAEIELQGKGLTVDVIRRAARFAAQAAVPRAGSEYKQQVVAGLTRQILQEIAEEVGGEDA